MTSSHKEPTAEARSTGAPAAAGATSAPAAEPAPAGATSSEPAPAGGVVVGADGLPRSPWAYGDPLLLEYYDSEWGIPVQGEAAMFERLCLEGFQAGLSWLTILRKRPRFREVFAAFDPDAVAAFGPEDVEVLMTDPGIIRHRGKIEATIRNAQATIRLRDEGGLVALIHSFAPASTPTPQEMSEVPTRSIESEALSRELKRRGFSFVGPTTVYALFEAVGIVDTHLLGSHRRRASRIWPV